MPTTLLLALRIWKPNDISVKYPNFGVFFQIFMRKPKPKLKFLYIVTSALKGINYESGKITDLAFWVYFCGLKYID